MNAYSITPAEVNGANTAMGYYAIFGRVLIGAGGCCPDVAAVYEKEIGAYAKSSPQELQSGKGASIDENSLTV